MDEQNAMSLSTGVRLVALALSGQSAILGFPNKFNSGARLAVVSKNPYVEIEAEVRILDARFCVNASSSTEL